MNSANGCQHHNSFLFDKDGPLFFKYLKENHGWKTANIKLHGTVYCTPTFRTKKNARLNDNCFTKLGFTDQVNANQPRFGRYVQRFHKWCVQADEGSEDENDGDCAELNSEDVENRRPLEQLNKQLSQTAKDSVAGDKDDNGIININDDEETERSEASALSEASKSTVFDTPQPSQQPPRKRGRVSDYIPRKRTTSAARAPRSVQSVQSVTRHKARTTSRTRRRSGGQTPPPAVVQQVAPPIKSLKKRPPASTHAPTPSASQVELILTIRTNAHKLCEELRSLVARRGTWRALLRDKALLKDLTALDIEQVVAAVRRYDGSKSVNEALAQIETQLNELAKVGTGRPFAEEDERVARAVLGLLQRVGLEKAQAHPPASATPTDLIAAKASQPKISRLPAEVRSCGQELCKALEELAAQQHRREALAQDRIILTDPAAHDIDEVVAVVKRCGDGKARSIGEALKVIDEAVAGLCPMHVGRLFEARDVALLQDLAKLLRETFA